MVTVVVPVLNTLPLTGEVKVMVQGW